MFIIIGILMVLACVAGGFLMVNGPFAVLIQPSEFVVIGGACIGALVAGSPLKMLMLLTKKLPAALKGSPYKKAAYIELLQPSSRTIRNSSPTITAPNSSATR